MGRQFGAICNQCGTHLVVRQGGGRLFHLLHCDTCGSEKSIRFDQIREPHLRYLKGITLASDKQDRHRRENLPGEPMTAEEYHEAVEALCGKCDCGGQFRFAAPPRCPRCRTAYEQTGREETDVRYD